MSKEKIVERIQPEESLNRFIFDLSSLRLGFLEIRYRCIGKASELQLKAPEAEIAFPEEPYDDYLGIASVILSSPLEELKHPSPEVSVVRIHVREKTAYPAFVPTSGIFEGWERWNMDLYNQFHRDLLKVSVIPGDLITKGEHQGKYRVGAQRWGGILQARQFHNPSLRMAVEEEVEAILNKEIPTKPGAEMKVGFELVSFMGGIEMGVAVVDSGLSGEKCLDHHSLKISLPGTRVRLTAQERQFNLEVPPRENYLDRENQWDLLVGYPEQLPPFAK